MSIVKNAWLAAVGAAMFAVLPGGSAAAADAGTVIVSIAYGPVNAADLLKHVTQ